MKDRSGSKPSFQGYASPNYTPVPDELFDEQLPDLSGAELKVLLYIIRRTFGFKRESDNISLSQMLNGLRARDGRVLDRGVGLSKKTLLLAIKSLEDQNIVLTERRRSLEKGDEPTVYRLNVRPASLREESTPPVGEKLHQGGGGETPPGPWGKNYTTQETVVQHTVRQHTVEQQTESSKGPDISNLEKPNASRFSKKNLAEEEQTGEPTEPVRARRADAGFQPIGHLISFYQSRLQDAAEGSKTKPKSTASPSSHQKPSIRDRVGEKSPWLLQLITDISAEFHDEDHTEQNLVQALRLWDRSGLPQDSFCQLVYEAGSLSKQ